jgi:hypothetical protein
MKKEKHYKKAVKVWGSMILRCYDEKLHNMEETYFGCSVCNDWLLFSFFYEWFKDNYYELTEERVQLDKDILVKHNKIYSPDKCCFVPQTINSLFTKNNKNRGDTPIGVSWINRDEVYRAQCNNGYKKRVSLGDYSNPIDAFNAYKEYKESVIKKIADIYKDVLNNKVYEALYKYEVEITD